MNRHYPSCTACTWTHRPIKGDGPQPCDILFIGEGPARDEIRRGFPFAGKSGTELNERLLRKARLFRPEVRITNATLCPFPQHGDRLRNPTHEEAEVCAAWHLAEEITNTNPKYIITLGGVSAHLFKHCDTDEPIDLEKEHGYAYECYYALPSGHVVWSGWLIPMYHPAAGMRDTRMMTFSIDDFKSLPAILQLLKSGEYVPPGTRKEECHYRELTQVGELETVLDNYMEIIRETNPYGGDAIAVDTEHDESSPDKTPVCLTFSMLARTGYLINAANIQLLNYLFQFIVQSRPVLVCHGMAGDLATLSRMGLPIESLSARRLFCTLMRASQLQDVSGSLKVLAYRLCGMRMRTYEEVVDPYCRAVGHVFVYDLCKTFEEAYQFVHTLKAGPRKGETELRWMDSTPKELKEAYNLLAKIVRDPQCSPMERWDGWRHDIQEAIREMSGGLRIPARSITLIPRNELIEYACADADSNIRIYPILRARGYRIGREINT